MTQFHMSLKVNTEYHWYLTKHIQNVLLHMYHLICHYYRGQKYYCWAPDYHHI